MTCSLPSRFSWVAGLLAVLGAGTAAGQGASVGPQDPSGILGASQRLERKDVVPGPVLEAIRDLGAGIEESGKKVRLKKLVLSEKQSILQLEVEDALKGPPR